MLTLVKQRHWTKVINKKRYYWPLSRFTRQEAECECRLIEAEALKQKLVGNLDWTASEMDRARLQAELKIGFYRYLAEPEVKPATAAPYLVETKEADGEEETITVNDELQFDSLVNLFLTESITLSDKKKKDLRNRLATTKPLFNGAPIKAYTRPKLIAIANAVNARDISDYYKRDIFQALYRLFVWAENRENLGFAAPGNLKQIFTPVMPKKTAAEVWGEDDEKYWTREEIKLALKHAKGEMRAFILLGLNCGYGTSEIGALEKSHIKEHGTVIQTIRGKTARNARPAKLKHYLWPETMVAIEEAICLNSPFVFATSSGGDVATNDYVGKLYRAFCKKHKLTLPQFKMLRKTSANAVKRLGDSDLASLHLGHSTKTVTEAFYTDANWNALKNATDRMREEYLDAL